MHHKRTRTYFRKKLVFYIKFLSYVFPRCFVRTIKRVIMNYFYNGQKFNFFRKKYKKFLSKKIIPISSM